MENKVLHVCMCVFFLWASYIGICKRVQVYIFVYMRAQWACQHPSEDVVLYNAFVYMLLINKDSKQLISKEHAFMILLYNENHDYSKTKAILKCTEQNHFIAFILVCLLVHVILNILLIFHCNENIYLFLHSFSHLFIHSPIHLLTD